jgi:hypothetical protein
MPTCRFVALVLVLALVRRLVEDRPGRADALEAAGRVSALAVSADGGVFALVFVETLPAAAVDGVALVADATSWRKTQLPIQTMHL